MGIFQELSKDSVFMLKPLLKCMIEKQVGKQER